jgi:hypothetical protein
MEASIFFEVNDKAWLSNISYCSDIEIIRNVSMTV